MAKLLRFNNAHYIHFVTTRTWKNIPYFKDKKNCLLLLEIIAKVRNKLEFQLRGFCLMPEHIHLLIEPYLGANEFAPTRANEFVSTPVNEFAPTRAKGVLLGSGRSDFNRTNISYVVKRIKGYSSRLINHSLNRKGIFWRKDFYDFNIYSDKKFKEKLNYIHNNPSRAGLVKNLDDYPWSSYQNYCLDKNSLIEIDY